MFVVHLLEGAKILAPASRQKIRLGGVGGQWHQITEYQSAGPSHLRQLSFRPLGRIGQGDRWKKEPCRFSKMAVTMYVSTASIDNAMGGGCFLQDATGSAGRFLKVYAMYRLFRVAQRCPL